MNFVVTSSPHIRGKRNTQQIMRDVVIALLPTLIAGTIIFGMRALLVTLVCVAAAVAAEWACGMVLYHRNTVKDLSSVVTGLLFLVAIVLSPVFCAIPGFATAPALIYVGFLMISSVVEIDMNDLTEAVPAYLCLIGMPLFYSISEGIALGVISYVLINLVTGKAKKITPLMYILAVLFVLKYMFL
jgi:xanthine/uracil/vitamin C permease (AzgA family)